MDETAAISTPNGPVVVRRARLGEAEAMRALRLRALAESPAAFGSTLDRERALEPEVWLDRTLRAATAPDTATFLAVRADTAGDELVGMCGGRVDPDREATCHLFGMWVAPEVRRSGVAGALVAAVEGWAASARLARMSLNVVATNERAIRLYRRLGYRETGVRKPLREGSAEVNMEMERTLGGAEPEQAAGDRA